MPALRTKTREGGHLDLRIPCAILGGSISDAYPSQEAYSYGDNAEFSCYFEALLHASAGLAGYSHGVRICSDSNSLEILKENKVLYEILTDGVSCNLFDRARNYIGIPQLIPRAPLVICATKKLYYDWSNQSGNSSIHNDFEAWLHHTSDGVRDGPIKPQLALYDPGAICRVVSNYLGAEASTLGQDFCVPEKAMSDYFLADMALPPQTSFLEIPPGYLRCCFIEDRGAELTNDKHPDCRCLWNTIWNVGGEEMRLCVNRVGVVATNPSLRNKDKMLLTGCNKGYHMLYAYYCPFCDYSRIRFLDGRKAAHAALKENVWRQISEARPLFTFTFADVEGVEDQAVAKDQPNEDQELNEEERIEFDLAGDWRAEDSISVEKRKGNEVLDVEFLDGVADGDKLTHYPGHLMDLISAFVAFWSVTCFGHGDTVNCVETPFITEGRGAFIRAGVVEPALRSNYNTPSTVKQAIGSAMLGTDRTVVDAPTTHSDPSGDTAAGTEEAKESMNAKEAATHAPYAESVTSFAHVTTNDIARHLERITSPAANESNYEACICAQRFFETEIQAWCSKERLGSVEGNAQRLMIQLTVRGAAIASAELESTDGDLGEIGILCQRAGLPGYTRQAFDTIAGVNKGIQALRWRKQDAQFTHEDQTKEISNVLIRTSPHILAYCLF